MEARRFDGIARAWAGAMNRRGALRSVAALLLAGGSGAQSLLGADAQERRGSRCSSNADCRSRSEDRCIRARCRRGRCSFVAIRCAGGYRCCGNGRCCENDPVPGCTSHADCSSNDPCVRSRCRNGRCRTLVVDCAVGFTCCGNGACCPVD